MSKRLHPTLADYLVIAVSPALIMALVGSLIFFLLDIFYQGQYVERLHVVFALFVMAAVLVGRISIEMGSSHAMMYATPLAIVTVLALNKFVQYPSGAVAAYSLWVNVGLIGLILWCAHKLTWDCTFIDESQEESGEGVLRTMGLDPPSAKRHSQTSEVSEISEVPGTKKVSGVPSGKPRPHSGGVWVVYFSLAALPLFGVGQRFLPADNLDRRRYAFLLLCVYVASGLGLLLTTSFLGLRRYLRGRRLQMPTTMAGAWVMIGCILIAAILGFAVLLPRPSPEYAISEVPWQMTSEKRSASRYAVGKEGTEDSRKDAPGGEDHTPANAKKQSGQPADGPKAAEQQGRDRDAKGKAATSRRTPKASDAKAPKGSGSQRESSGQDTSQSGQTREGKSADSQDAAGEQKGGSQPQGKSGASGEQKGSQDQAKGSASDGQKGPQEQAKGSSSGEQKGPQDQKQSRSSAGQKSSRDQRADSQRGAKSQDPAQGKPPQPQTPQTPPPLPSWSVSWGGILKWVFYLALILAVAYFAWRSRAALVQALRDFLEAWRAFWASLFGPKGGPKQARPGETASETKAAPRPFADYADPFAAGWAERWSPDELVRYSFAALEAWAREHGCPRGPEQTPHEFADNVGDRSKHLKGHCRKMADLYSRAAYASGTLSATSTTSLREFWQQLTSAPK